MLVERTASCIQSRRDDLNLVQDVVLGLEFLHFSYHIRSRLQRDLCQPRTLGRGAGFQTRENALSCNDRALALVRMPQAAQSTRTFFVTSTTAGRKHHHTYIWEPRTSVRGSGFERKTGTVCLVIGVSKGRIGRTATRAKALKYMYRSVLAGLKTRSPDYKVRGWHESSCSLLQIEC
jgi:hypothetical protein